MLKLREYQKVAVALATEYLRGTDTEPALIVLPTGWGKSILTAFAATGLPEGERLLVVQPTKELLEQNYGKYITLCEDNGYPVEAGIFSASFGKKDIARITYATIGSIKDMGRTFREYGCTKMLIDEAHLYPRKEESMLGAFLSDSGISQVLGITATPLKLESFSEKQVSEKRNGSGEEKKGVKFDKWSSLTMLTNPSPDGSFFRKILHVGQVQEMTRLGYWSPLTYEVLPFDGKSLKMNSTGSEFDERSQEEAYRFNMTRLRIYGALNHHTERRHCLVFTPTVEEAAVLAQGYPGAEHVSGQTPARERKEIIRRFREGTTRVLFNCSMLGTGFDYPGIDMIIFAISTASVARYYQFCGRGVRIDRAKRDCVIVDLGGNYRRFGRVEDIHFEKWDRWRMYGSGGQLLSGIPIDCIGFINRDDIREIYGRPRTRAILNFGRHRGKEPGQVPMSYRKWLLKNPGNMDRGLLTEVARSIENHVRDTRNEPPEIFMRNGTHSGKLISEVPRGYLKWYLGSTSWNECNDSLLRGIKLALGMR